MKAAQALDLTVCHQFLYLR